MTALTSKSWQTTIGALCERFGGEVQTGPFGSQLHASDYSTDGTPVVMPQDMVDGHIVPDRAARVSGKHVKALARHVLRTGDIVFSRRGDVRRFAVVTEKEAGWLCGTGSIRIRLNSPEVCVRYARQYLRQESIGAWLENEAKGVTMPNLNTQIIRALPFVCPPLTEQRRIAAILDRAETLRAQRRAAIAQLDSLGQAVFLKMFGNPTNNSFSLSMASLDELGEWRSGGTPPRTESSYFEGTIPWFSSGELDTMYVWHSAEHVSESAIRETSAKRVPTGALMLGMYDTAALKASIAGVDCSCNQAIAFARINPLRANVVYVYFSIVIGRDHFRRMQRGVRQKNLNLSMVRALRIPLPPIDQQDKFAEHVRSIENLKAIHRAALARLDELFASLGHSAFRGELTHAYSFGAMRKLEAPLGLEALIFVAKRTPGQDLYKALKTVYLADKYHLEQHGRLLYGETHSAMQYGPVPEAAYESVRFLRHETMFSPFGEDATRSALTVDGQRLLALRDADLKKLGNALIDSLQWAIGYCAEMSFEQVKTASHDTAYNRTRANESIPVEYLIDMLPAEARKRHWNL